MGSGRFHKVTVKIKAIRLYYDEMKSGGQIARELGIPRQTVYRWLKDDAANSPKRRKARSPSHAQKLLYCVGARADQRRKKIIIAAKLRAEGFQVNQIALLLRVTDKTIHNYLNHHISKRHLKNVRLDKRYSKEERPPILCYKQFLKIDEVDFIQSLQKGEQECISLDGY